MITWKDDLEKSVLIYYEKKKAYRVAEYRKHSLLNNLTPITKDTIDNWALRRVSCFTNCDINKLLEELLESNDNGEDNLQIALINEPDNKLMEIINQKLLSCKFLTYFCDNSYKEDEDMLKEFYHAMIESNKQIQNVIEIELSIYSILKEICINKNVALAPASIQQLALDNRLDELNILELFILLKYFSCGSMNSFDNSFYKENVQNGIIGIVLQKFNEIIDSYYMNILKINDNRVKIWLDDERNSPNSCYTICKSVNQCKKVIKYCEHKHIEIEFIDCDHDLGNYSQEGGDGIKLLDWLIERKTFYPIQLHTMNPVGRENMQRTINRYWKNI
ncbi:MAG: hypothetical protein PHX62_00075 [Bacilli bacterium]|nr:hypothetical protein [Bacilli bacterium]